MTQTVRETLDLLADLKPDKTGHNPNWKTVYVPEPMLEKARRRFAFLEVNVEATWHDDQAFVVGPVNPPWPS